MANHSGMSLTQDKICSECHLLLPASDFNIRRSGIYHHLSGCCRKCQSKRMEKFWANPKNKERKFENRLQREFGITIEQYYEILRRQQFCCAICHNELTGKICCDHDHSLSIKKIRGLLCHNCNSAIGLLREKEEIILSAIEYLNKTRGGKGIYE
jgi:hypothetical protein